jgi:hypothetical protein
MKDGKTRRISGVDCPRHAFAYAPDDIAANWALPLWIPGDAKKSLNALKTSMHHFDSAKIPDSERDAVWFTLYGALLAHGIKTDRRTFAPKTIAAAEPTPPPPVTVKTKPIKKDAMVEAVVAEADRRCNELLRSLGLE